MAALTDDELGNFELLHGVDGGAFGVGLHSFKQTSVSIDIPKRQPPECSIEYARCCTPF